MFSLFFGNFRPEDLLRMDPRKDEAQQQKRCPSLPQKSACTQEDKEETLHESSTYWQPRRWVILEGPTRSRARSGLFNRTFPIATNREIRISGSHALAIALHMSQLAVFLSFDRNFFLHLNLSRRLIDAFIATPSI